MQAAFYKGTRPGLAGLFNRAVRWWTGGRYSHCELVLAGPREQAICASASNVDGGVRIKTINLDPVRWDIIDFEGSEQQALDWFAAHLGAGYDFLGLFGFLWRRQDGDARKWFCSESFAAAIGLPDPWRFCPNTLAAVLRGRYRE